MKTRRKRRRPLRSTSSKIDHQRPQAETLIVYATDRSGHRRARRRRLSDRERIQGFFHRPEARQARHARLRYQRAGVRGADPKRTCSAGSEQRHHPDVPASTMSGWCWQRDQLGVMQACIDVVMPYIHERQQFGRPMGEFQLVQARSPTCMSPWMRARPMFISVAKACDRGERRAKTLLVLFCYATRTPPRLRSMRLSFSRETATSMTIPPTVSA